MKTVVRKDKTKGRGLYAKFEIKKDEIIETCELILISLDEIHGTLEGYVYQYSKDTAAIALGNGSLLNHSNRSNCEFYFNYKTKHLKIKAKKRILPGQEITINYRYGRDLKKKFGIY